jgi:TRAP-type C4-dicarboxylate transport system permease small subunit
MNRWDRLDDFIARIEKYIVVVLLGLMMVLAFMQIVLRNFFQTGLSWGDVLVRYLVLWVAFIGAALATKEGRHINMEVLSRWVSETGEKYLKGLSHLCSIFICGLLTYAAGKFIHFEAQMGGTIIFGLPIWIPELIIPVAFGLMTLRYGLRCVREFSKPDRKP